MWRNIITALYPDALRRTYRVPPEHFNRVPYDKSTVPRAGLPALVLPVRSASPAHTVPPASQPSGATPVPSVPPSSQTPGRAAPGGKVLQFTQRLRSLMKHVHSLWTQDPQPPATPVRVQESDVRDDFSVGFVLKNLQVLGEDREEVMFIVSQLKFGNYLNQPSYAAAAAHLPRPINLDPSYREGDFDVLVIHRHHGILVGELKAVGMPQANFNPSQPQADSNVAKKVRQAVEQLDKSEALVKHLVSDIAPGLTVRKTLFLPFVSGVQLHRVLTASPQLEQEVCCSLGAGNIAEAIQLCCCSDQLSDPATYWDVTPAVLSQLTKWWQHRVACTVDTVLTDDLYLDIVARFVGPATSVTVHCNVVPRMEVRTVGEAVAELGRRLARLVLTPQQLDLMQRSPPRVFLTGPPGTGKTIMLVLQGLGWLRQGHDVDVVVTHPSRLAANVMIQHQLRMTLLFNPSVSPRPGTVRRHQYDFYKESDVDKAISDLSSAGKGGTLCVLMDEAMTGSGLQRLVSGLTGRVQNLNIWVAGVFHTNITTELQKEVLTTPLRCAPAVLREVGPVVDRLSGHVHSYTDSGLPAPGDGPSVVRLDHRGNAHTGQQPTDCAWCGHEVAFELRRLDVGTRGRYVTNNPASLAYRDVFVLTTDDNLHDDVIDDAGNVTPASHFVRALRDKQVPVCVLEDRDRAGSLADWERRVADVAVAQTDRVTVAHWKSVLGLERRVVVWLAERGRDDDAFKLHGFSRCTTQLIIVAPRSDDRHT